MFEKLFQKLEGMSNKKLLAIAIISGIATLISLIVYLNAQRYFWVIFIVAFACLCVFFTTLFFSNRQEKRDEEKAEKLLSEIKEFLCVEEFREVEFSPNITEHNGIVIWKDENLARCLRIEKGLKVRHFAKIKDDGCIIVIARDANGETIGIPDAYTPSFFNDNYKVLK